MLDSGNHRAPCRQFLAPLEAALFVWPRSFLALLGRYGPTAFGLSLLVGFALPWLARPVKPILGAIIFCFIAINMMRADLPALRRLAQRPSLIATLLAWNTLLPFAVVGAIVAIFGRAAFEPGLLLGMAVTAAAPPLVAAPAYALLLGFSNAVPLTVLVLGMAITPLSAPLIADAIVGSAAPIDQIALTIRLAIFLFGAMAVGLAIRKAVGETWLSKNKPEFDGAGVVLFFVFAIALTESVSQAAFADLGKVALYLGIAFAICIICFVLTWLAWRRFHRREAVTLAIATGLRNTGLIIAAMGVNTVPDATFLFFALMQFPVYFAPQLLKPFVGAMAGNIKAKEEIAAG
ncbi:hypothetical protein [Terrarubrum flagellatum]|uniref:hypothetical protein n=1 Tax=Terrirubrum flagellatum TaxID=2895980 RepID=UPI00314552CD